MRRSVRNIFAVLAVSLFSARALFALSVHVPEIDSAMSIGAFTLLGGVVMVMRGQSRR
jgi:hypothetical protein